MRTLQGAIADILEKGDTPNQTQLSKEFGVSRSTVSRAIKKHLLSAAGDSSSGSVVEQNPEAYDIQATENGAVSATPLSAAPVSVGDIWKWGKNPTEQNYGLIVGVDEALKIIAVVKVEGGEINQPKEFSLVSFKNWKKRPALTHSDVDHLFIASQDMAKDRKLFNPTEGLSEAFYGHAPSGSTVISEHTCWSLYLKNEVKPYNHGMVVDTDEEREEVTDTSQIEVAGGQVKGAMKGAMGCPFRLTVSKRSITAVIGSEVLSVTADEPSFEPCVEAVQSSDWGRVEELCRLRNKKAVNYQEIISRCGFKVQGGYVVMSNGTGKVALGGIDTVVKRLDSLALSGDEEGIQKIGRFVDKLLDNPDPVIMNRIVDFIKFGDVDIDDDGDLITYKYVNSDYLDSHSRTLSNRPGSEVFMKRILVDANIDNECSSGLHVCALSYAFKFWGSDKRLVKCKLNPRDIVAIPRDYKGAKIRCCRYLVLEDVTAQFLNRKIPLDFKGFFG